MKNFIIVKSIDFPSGAASGQYVRLLIRGIRAAGEKSCFISPFNFSRLGAEKRRAGHDGCCPYLNLSAGSGGRFLPALLRSWIGNLKVLFLLASRKKRGRTDIILYGNGSPMHDWPLLMGCGLFRIPLFAWCVELESAPWVARTDSREKINYWNGRLAEEWLPKITCGYIVISKRLEEFYRQRGCDVYVSPILVDPAPSAQPLAPGPRDLYPNRKVLVYSGTFEEKDGVHSLLDALKTLTSKFPEILLVMTGKALRRGGEQLMKRVSDHIERDGLSEHVELTGFVDRDYLDRINQCADLFLVCRTNSRFANFGLPWKTGEYAMTGKPIVATDVSDLSLYFEDRKSIFLARPEDPESIAWAIEVVFENYNRALEAGQKGREVAMQAFDYRVHGRNTAAFIEKCLSQGRGL